MSTLERIKVIAHGLAVQFGPSCEVLIHDLQGDINSSLVYIENGTITNRHVGDGPSHVVLDVLSHDDGSEGRFGYLTKTKDGRILKSSTMYIRDDTGRIAYLLGINQDITEFVMMHRLLDSLSIQVRKMQDLLKKLRRVYRNYQMIYYQTQSVQLVNQDH